MSYSIVSSFSMIIKFLAHSKPIMLGRTTVFVSHVCIEITSKCHNPHLHCDVYVASIWMTYLLVPPKLLTSEPKYECLAC